MVHTGPNPLSPRTAVKVLGLRASESEPAIDAAVKTSQKSPLARATRQADSRPVLKRLRMFNKAAGSLIANA
jgi:hypothetical protein